MLSPWFVDLVGYCAAFCTTSAFLPQILHTLKTRDTKGLSLKMYIIMTFGTFCWLSYGILLDSWPMIAANLVSLTLVSAVLLMKLRHG